MLSNLFELKSDYENALRSIDSSIQFRDLKNEKKYHELLFRRGKVLLELKRSGKIIKNNIK